MPRIIDYRIVHNTDDIELSASILELLKKGWFLHGDPFYNAKNEYCQALCSDGVNYTKTEDKGVMDVSGSDLASPLNDEIPEEYRTLSGEVDTSR